MPLLHSESAAGAAPGHDLTRRRLALRLAVPALLLTAAMIVLGLLLTHTFAHWWLLSTEDGVDRSLAARRDPALNQATSVLSTVANTIGTVIIAAAACLVTLWLTRRRREVAFIATALAIEVSAFLVTTLLVHRPRPGGLELDHSPPTSSFPSGHSAAAVALYGAIAWLLIRHTGRLYALALLLMPAAVGFARLYRGMHHPSDVAAGFLLGACAVLIAGRALLEPQPSRVPARPARASSRTRRGAAAPLSEGRR
ncbi:phosphatase PAP2 family protein [Actinocrinis puniceicyclus]|uniref:Phosphatase PAP2 family protein n=1 Tax=Actinocrinis puniceicyclus TaxID=977794 RepID=A0A8J7WPI4_9ACTN|nr:phosphatase PAP2 family protein [Actinocrinis puniceicyclus]MBS2963169.1 phosphatase PAP2 family protein [Actinocrinis puniceicyclus]